MAGYRKSSPEQRSQDRRSDAEERRLFKEALREYHRRQVRKKRLRALLAVLAIAAIVLYLCWPRLMKLIHREEPPLPADDRLKVCFIDVGQGDSTLITAGGKTMLVDCGEEEFAGDAAKFLKSSGIERIDYLVGTHPHSDHMGGMYRIIEDFDIGEVIIPDMPDEMLPTTRTFEKFLDACHEKGLSITRAEPGRFIYIGDARAEIVGPQGSDYTDLNNYSVSLYIRHGKNSFLLTGDAEEESEADMLSSGQLRHADVYKVGHHGSSSSSSAAFLRTVSPDYAVISCGAENPYGHPHESVMERLKRYTDKIYRTDNCGTITFTSDGETLEVSTERN